MKRREFVGGVLIESPVWDSTAGGFARQSSAPRELPGSGGPGEVVIECPVAGQPHSGKALVAIQPMAMTSLSLREEQ